ncbi:uncharacterized protein CC84DRAFT_804173 [Paraphaeosphaeria sporulosa]|uniref:Uncharacterized protein n=1 Tax=Paraphaeosphaeria sporulosa TaxID=1460663 RepID=A0A177CDN9_9PLEO|nr:uncharacterized protein CC84DRAFT_804173 [Paraphaeosphaeria sporulosa]OAG04820.1 hypothetical protein CC84DRAFT_804173 [Paraphaeosphaeria sporulosa]
MRNLGMFFRPPAGTGSAVGRCDLMRHGRCRDSIWSLVHITTLLERRISCMCFPRIAWFGRHVESELAVVCEAKELGIISCTTCSPTFFSPNIITLQTRFGNPQHISRGFVATAAECLCTFHDFVFLASCELCCPHQVRSGHLPISHFRSACLVLSWSGHCDPQVELSACDNV